MDALVRLFAARDGLLERYEPTPWGAIVADARFPLIYDANYARVDRDSPPLTAGALMDALAPALEAAGCPQLHVVLMDAVASSRLLPRLETLGGETARDTVMRHELGAPARPSHPVEEVRSFDDRFWGEVRATVPGLGLVDPAIMQRFVDQFVRWERQVLVPGGQRWFRVRMDGETAGLGALFVAGDAAYVDDVFTFERFRRRGVAGALVLRLVEEARRAGARDIMLLADEPDPIRLYGSLGFAPAGEIVNWQRPAV